MFILKYKLLFSMVIIRSYAEVLVSKEINEQNDRKDKNTYSKVERRFIDDLDDESWHISHLKESDFSGRRIGCPEDTFEDKVKKYRKALQNDGALVEYVSADALPFDEEALKQDMCKTPAKKDIFLKTNVESKTNAPKQESVEVNRNDTKGISTNETGSDDGHDTLHVATTTTKKVKGHKNKPPSGRKASEYQFSSIEYYDETTDFDYELCPDDVEVIILDISHQRNYDIKCEQILEWRSLDDN